MLPAVSIAKGSCDKYAMIKIMVQMKLPHHKPLATHPMYFPHAVTDLRPIWAQAFLLRFSINAAQIPSLSISAHMADSA